MYVLVNIVMGKIAMRHVKPLGNGRVGLLTSQKEEHLNFTPTGWIRVKFNTHIP